MVINNTVVRVFSCSRLLLMLLLLSHWLDWTLLVIIYCFVVVDALWFCVKRKKSRETEASCFVPWCIQYRFQSLQMVVKQFTGERVVYSPVPYLLVVCAYLTRLIHQYFILSFDEKNKV